MSAVNTHGQVEPINDEYLVDLVKRALLGLQRSPANMTVDWPNVTIQQLRVMSILYCDGPTRVSVLARRLDVSTPTITGILDRLVKQGLTTRTDDPNDRRVVLNALTDEGWRVMEQLSPVDVSDINNVIQSLSLAERTSVANGLQALLKACQQRQ